MKLRVAIQMDPLESINPKGDTSLRMGLEAQKRGHELWHYTPDKLSWLDGKLFARANRVTLFDDMAHYYDMGEEKRLDVSELDVVLLRQDPPFHMGYLSTTYMLEQLRPKPLVVNHPSAVRNFPEKWFPAHFRQFMPATLVSRDVAELEAFRKEHGEIVIKPLYGNGGRGVFHIKRDDDNIKSLCELMFAQTPEPVIAQQFLPEVAKSDLRVILIEGEVVGAFGRIPAIGEIRANLRVGARAIKAELTPRQREACEAMKPLLQKEGLIFAGVDFIGDWLTEVNLTSPTGFASLTELYGTNPAGLFWDAIQKKLS